MTHHESNRCESTHPDSTRRESWQRAYEVLDELLDLGADARRQRLGELDLTPKERERVESLLRADESDGGVLDRPVDTAIDGYVAVTGRIGPWRLGPEIGRGGMSVVYRATRDDAGFEQTAALKLLHATRLDPASIERFRREQQILADLHHPNLATLLDGGVTPDGTPFLVMEEIRGARLDAYCVDQSLDARGVVELMLPICDAVAFAHRSLVVHRDLKPANILVDDDGRPRLLDFGVAKLLARDDPEHTTTRVLTPGFGAPEQATGRAVTTATDVFGLGAVLYRLLARSMPYPADAFLVDSRDLPRPTAPSRATEGVHGIDSDLDNVVRKALRVEPERRYASVEAMARDLRNWLDGLPVSATPDRLVYRLRKLASRHRTAMVAAAVAVLGLLAGSGVALWQASVARGESERAQRSAAQAESQAERAEAVTDFLVQTISAADPEAQLGADATVRQVIDAGVERIGSEMDSELADEPETRARLRSVLGKISYRLGEFERALAILDENLSADGLSAEIRLHDQVVAANCARVLGRAKEAERRFFEAIELAQAMDPVNLAIAESAYASFLIAVGRTDEALARLDNSSAQTWLESAPVDELADLEETLAQALVEQGRIDEAAAHAERALELRLAGGESMRTAVAMSLGQLSNVRAEQGDLEAAAELKRRALAIQMELLGPKHVNTQVSRNDLATLFKNLGRFDESAELLESVLAQQVELLGPEHRHVADAHFALGQALFLAGRRNDSLAHYRRAAEISDLAPAGAGPFHGVHHAIYGHALVLTDPSAASEGEVEIQLGVRLVSDLLGPDHPLTARVRTLYAEVLNELGRHDEARGQMEAALPILDAAYGQESRHAALARIELGRALFSSSPEEAQVALRDAIAAFRDSSYRHQYARQIGNAESVLAALL